MNGFVVVPFHDVHEKDVDWHLERENCKTEKEIKNEVLHSNAVQARDDSLIVEQP